ncbi:MAG: hypothetical protein J5497_07055, partial [Selenomonadaceae bacterium]|nr:hypothetical protein [Selenomonadaceae bacterium]
EYIREPALQEVIFAQWWENDVLTASGRGIVPENLKDEGISRAVAKRAAVMDAYRNLAVQAGNVRITKEKNLSKREVDVLLKGAELVSADYDEDGSCTVVMKIPIYGVTNSVAGIAFKPVDKEDFLPPSETVTTEGNYTGLIIDCGDTELNPILSPIIRNEKKQSIYSYKNLSYDTVLASGMIGYEQKFDGDETQRAENQILLLTADGSKNNFIQVGSKILIADNDDKASRAGDNPLIIKAVNTVEDGTCPVIAGADADKILAENGISHFLDNGSVVFKSKRIRGTRW